MRQPCSAQPCGAPALAYAMARLHQDSAQFDERLVVARTVAVYRELLGPERV